MSVTYESVVNAAFAIVNLTDEQKKELLLKLLKNDPEPVIAALCNDNVKPIQLEEKYNVVLSDTWNNHNIPKQLQNEYCNFHFVIREVALKWWRNLKYNGYVFAENLSLDVARNLSTHLNSLTMENITDVEQQIKEA